MPAAPQTLLIPFNGGLDTWSNAQLLKPGYLTASTGTMLDRPGLAYAGPGYNPVEWAPNGETRTNYGIGAMTGGVATNNDRVLVWSTRQDGDGPGIVVPDEFNEPPVMPLAPWRQTTQRFQSDFLLTYDGSTALKMVGPPQTAIVGSRVFYVWLVEGGTAAMAYQDLDTRLWSGPYYLTTTWEWTATPLNGVTQPTTVTAIALGGDSTYLRMAFLESSTLNLAAYNAQTPTTLAAAVTTVAGTYRKIDMLSTGDEYATYGGTCPGAVVAYKDNSPDYYLIGFPFNGSSASFGADELLVTSDTLSKAYPITCTPVRARNAASAQFAFLAFAYSSTYSGIRPQLCVTDTACANATVTDINTTAYTSTGLTQITIANTTSGSTSTFVIAGEITLNGRATGITGKTYGATRIILGTATGSSYATGETIWAWGGAALLGKFYQWYDGADFLPVFAMRTGWYHNEGTWGTISTAGTATIAYPNGYLYDYRGNLLARFGDADVGTESLWPAFDNASYTANDLQPLPAGFTFTLDSGQRTLTYAWPQYGYFDFVSTRAADSGSPIGARAGLSTVTWLAPTAAEPPAPMTQFGNTMVIPGTITAYYDGSNLFEAGFFTRAPTPYAGSKGSGGSLPNATTYYYQTVLSYTDAAGRVHRSAPSRVVAVTTAVANDSIDLAFPTLQQTLHDNTATALLEVYRSTGNPTEIVMYRVTSLVVPARKPGTFPITSVFNDTTPDADLTQCATIYTYGQAAGASTGTDAPPPFDCLTIWNNQLWGLANRNGPELWCSWPLDNAVLAPEGPAWSSQNRIALPAEIGQPKALAGLDERLFILGSRKDYGIVGQAPSRDVSLSDEQVFSAVTALPSPGGIRVLNGVTALPDGILFQGTQGFAVLGRDLKYSRVGRPVNQFANSNLYLPGVFLPDQQAVLLFSASANTADLMYFYDQDEWAQPEHPARDPFSATKAPVIVGTARSATGQTSYAYVLPAAYNYYHSTAPYSAAVSYRTPWIELRNLDRDTANLAGYGMLREVHVLGQFPYGINGGATLTLYTEYDYEGNTLQAAETQSIDLTTDTQVTQDFQWRFGFSQGNARRVRFTVTVAGLATDPAETQPYVLLSGLSLSYDVDTGLSRLGAANSIGT